MSAVQTHLRIADIRPPYAFGDLELNTKTGKMVGTNVRQKPCEHYGGRLLNPTVIMIHFTAGPGAASQSIKAMDDRGVSAHVVVDRAGGIWQCVPFTRIAYHAGHGDWEGYHNTMNHHSFGIELSNLGPLWLTPKGQYVDCYGIERTDRVAIPMPHRNARLHDLKKLIGDAAYKKIVDKGVKDPDLANCFWEVFPDEQQKALQRLCSLLVTRYPSVRAIIGHDDYAIQRKIDPGPALQLQKLLGWMPRGRTILYIDDFQRNSYAFSRGTDDYLRNRTASRTFGAGVPGRDIG